MIHRVARMPQTTPAVDSRNRPTRTMATTQRSSASSIKVPLSLRVSDAGIRLRESSQPDAQHQPPQLVNFPRPEAPLAHARQQGRRAEVASHAAFLLSPTQAVAREVLLTSTDQRRVVRVGPICCHSRDSIADFRCLA